MRKIPGLVIGVLLLHTIVFSQENSGKQDPTFGVHFLFDDFTTAELIRTTSLSDVLKNKQFGKIKEMSPGLALNYIEGLNKYFDFTTTLAGSFLSYRSLDGRLLGESDLLLEGDVSIRGKMFSNKYWLSPYIQVGTGISKFKGYWGAFIPAGAGLQLNFFDEAFLLVNAQYRIPVTDNVNFHFFYSVGLAGIIGKNKSAPRALPPPPPPIQAPMSDRDGDGIADAADECPDVKGMVLFKGCPDSDNDGIPDKDDQCPLRKGIARYKGCPVPDTDGDGINDEEDKCPDQRGVARYRGCPVPDRDHDGVNDEDDQCPDLAGTVGNKGCPEVKEEVRKKIALASQNIFFATGSDQLLSKSFAALDEVASIMQEDKNLKLDIEGHTDNTGMADKNLVLSEKRARSVYNYLVSHAIDAGRLEEKGFGQNNPVADNTTAEGRRKNRRVELKLHYD